jgi:2-deoxy-D-gluconate 3-dehydrogenase
MNILEQFRLDGKVAMVTGCKRGIGKALALGIAEAGADIIGVSRTLEQSGSEIEEEVRALGRKFTGYRCDFADRQALYQFISKVKADNPVIDILFSNHGVSMFAEIENYPDDYWDKIIEVNLNSHFVLSREIGKDMLARGYGKIVFTASVMTFVGASKSSAYAASKGGIGQLTKTLANVWASRGVNVNAIAPGWIKTELSKGITEDPKSAEAMLARIPAGRLGMPDDLKGVAVFLASAASNFVHGTIVLVDGGQLAR